MFVCAGCSCLFLIREANTMDVDSRVKGERPVLNGNREVIP